MGVLTIVAAFSALAASTTQASWNKNESSEAAYVHFMRGEWLQLHQEQRAARDEYRYTKVFVPESRLLQRKISR